MNIRQQQRDVCGQRQIVLVETPLIAERCSAERSYDEGEIRGGRNNATYGIVHDGGWLDDREVGREAEGVTIFVRDEHSIISAIAQHEI